MTTRNESDPTNQSANRTKANRDNNRRLNKSAKEVLALWKQVPAKRVVKGDIKNNIDYYEYDTDIPITQVSEIINRNLDTDLDSRPFNWYFDEYTERAWRSGTIQENAWVTVLLSGTALAVIPTETLFLSPTYTVSLELLQDGSYLLIKNLANTTTSQIMQVIQSGIVSGLSRSAIARKISERFEVSKSAAARITNTEINRDYNNARMGAIDAYNENGIKLGVMHISALIATTRANHARRHGRVYTTQAQRRWWASGANRINCHCSTRGAVINNKNEVVDKKMQNKVRARGREFFKK